MNDETTAMAEAVVTEGMAIQLLQAGVPHVAIRQGYGYGQPETVERELQITGLDKPLKEDDANRPLYRYRNCPIDAFQRRTLHELTSCLGEPDSAIRTARGKQLGINSIFSGAPLYDDVDCQKISNYSIDTYHFDLDKLQDIAHMTWRQAQDLLPAEQQRPFLTKNEAVKLLQLGKKRETENKIPTVCLIPISFQ